MPAPKIKDDFLKKERERNRKHDAAMGRTATGRKKPAARVSSTKKSLADIRNRANENYAKKEEVEQLDELSPRTKASYLKKASDQNKKVQKAYDKSVKSSPDAFFGDDGPKDKERMKTMTKRQKGMAMAKGRKYGQAYESNYDKEYKHHSQGLKNAEADMKRAKTNDQMVKAMNKKAHHNKALSKMNRMESVNEKLSVSDGMGAWIDDFKKSDAPQFKGKSDKERRDMAIAAYLSAKRGDKKESVDEKVITKKMQQRALSKVRAQPKDKVSLPKAPWDKKKKEEGYVSMAQQRAVWATRKDGGKGHPDNKKGKKK